MSVNNQMTLDGQKHDPEQELEKYFKNAILAEFKETKTRCKVILYYLGEHNISSLKVELSLRISQDEFLDRWKAYQNSLQEEI